MADSICECPFCRGRFRVPTDGASEQMLCPHCRQVVHRRRMAERSEANPAVSNKPPPATQPTSNPATESQFLEPKRKSRDAKKAPAQIPPNIIVSEAPTPYNVGVANKSAERGIEQIAAATGPPPEMQGGTLDPELEKLLPPKFLVPGSLQRLAKPCGATHVILPNAEGGFQALDTSVRQIHFGGRTVAITSIPPSRKRLRRAIRSIIMFTICVAILFVVFYLLNR